MHAMRLYVETKFQELAGKGKERKEKKTNIQKHIHQELRIFQAHIPCRLVPPPPLLLLPSPFLFYFILLYFRFNEENRISHSSFPEYYINLPSKSASLPTHLLQLLLPIIPILSHSLSLPLFNTIWLSRQFMSPTSLISIKSPKTPPSLSTPPVFPKVHSRRKEKKNNFLLCLNKWVCMCWYLIEI